MNRRVVLTVAGLAALAVPVLMWGAFIVVARLRPEFDPLTQIGSRLGERGAPYAPLFNTVHFLLPGALLILVGAGLFVVLDDQVGGRMAAGLVALAGLSVLLSGIFTLDPTSDAQSAIHENLGTPFFLGIPCAALSLARALGHDVRARRPRILSRALGIFLVILVLLFLPLMHTGAIPNGLFQRIYLSGAHAWLVVIGLWLLRAARACYPEGTLLPE